MNYNVNLWDKSNCEVIIDFNLDDLEKYKNKFLLDYQKEFSMPWFRKWHVPLDYIKNLFDENYLLLAAYEYIINDVLKKIYSEWYNIIWDIYDFNIKDNKITFKIDLYPEVKELNDSRKRYTVSLMDLEPSYEDIENAFRNLQIKYASYEDIDEIVKDSIVKIKILKNQKDFSKYLYPEDIKEDYIWKKIWDKIEYDWSDDSLAEILEIKKVIYPEINEQFVKSYFNIEYEEFMDILKNEIKNYKKEQFLNNFRNEYYNYIKNSLDVQIPSYFIKTEIEKIKEKYKNDITWEYEEFLNDLFKSKLLMKYINEQLSLNSDINNFLDFAEKLYNYFLNTNK